MTAVKRGFIQRTVLLHGGRLISLLIPKDTTQKITAVNETTGYCLFLTNGSGYQLLSELFAAAVGLNTDECVYLPFGRWQGEKLKSLFPDQFLNGLVIVNYCAAQLKTTEIQTAVKTKIYTKKAVTRTCSLPDKQIERWEKENRLTVKLSGKLLIMSANGDVLSDLSQVCAGFSDYGDHSSYNLFTHDHYDLDENTSHSLGINFHYWHEDSP